MNFMGEKKIWIISEIYYPVKTSTGYYVTEIAESLASKGLDVNVICTSSIYNKGEYSSTLKEEVLNKVHIYRVYTCDVDKNNFTKRLFRLLYSSCKLFFKILSLVHTNDNILVVTNPAFLLLMMPYVKWRKKIKYRILVHDIFPENLIAVKKIRSSSFIYKFLKLIFDFAYSNAETCISIGRDMNKVLNTKIKSTNSILFIPTWSENDRVFPIRKSETKLYRSLGLSGKFIFQFAGNLGHAQGLDNILAAIRLMDNNNIHFLFIGGGAKYNTIREFIHDRDNVSLIDFQDRSMQNDFLNACDVAIVTLSDGMYGLGVPSKSYNIMAAGKPILMVGERDSEIALCVKEYDLGWIIESNNPVALKDAFELIYAQRESFSSIQNNARCVADTIFAKKAILDKYYQLFK